jgi:hypothetical protein
MFQDFTKPLPAAKQPHARIHWQVAGTARSSHAHMLDVAAARRLRAVERRRAQRQEDADYWKAVAPAALAKARALREDRSFAPLP